MLYYALVIFSVMDQIYEMSWSPLFYELTRDVSRRQQFRKITIEEIFRKWRKIINRKEKLIINNITVINRADLQFRLT